MRATLTPGIINAAIQGFEAQKQHLDAQIAGEIANRSKLGIATPTGIDRSASA
jgi:hypothetical protein